MSVLRAQWRDDIKRPDGLLVLEADIDDGGRWPVRLCVIATDRAAALAYLDGGCVDYAQALPTSGAAKTTKGFMS